MSCSICLASGESGTPFRFAGVEDGRGLRVEFGERRAMVMDSWCRPRELRERNGSEEAVATGIHGAQDFASWQSLW